MFDTHRDVIVKRHVRVRVAVEHEYGRPRLRVPHLQLAQRARLVWFPSPGDDPRAIRAEVRASNAGRVAVEFEQGRPVCASQTFAVWSQLPVTIRLPSGLKRRADHVGRVAVELQQGAVLAVPHPRARLVPKPR